MDGFPPDAYFAGLIDGEAAIYLANRKGRSPIPTVEVNMTCERTVRMLQARFGGTLRQRKPMPPGIKMQWGWRVESRLARTVIFAIRPFSVTRREAVETIVAQQKEQGLWKESEGGTLLGGSTQPNPCSTSRRSSVGGSGLKRVRP